jgi:ribose 5-phosphate isomerase
LTADDHKRSAALKALELVQRRHAARARHRLDGGDVRRGAGRAGGGRPEGDRRSDVAGDPSQAEALGIPLAEPDETELDLTVDGADEIDARLNLIKGGGGALLREKIVAASSRRMIVIADASKRVETLGRFPLPVEIIPFGARSTIRRIAEAARQVGCEGDIVLRRSGNEPLVTDNGNWIADCHFGAIPAPADLAVALAIVPGVVEHGLFVALCTGAIIGGPDGPEVLAMPAQRATKRTDSGLRLRPLRHRRRLRRGARRPHRRPARRPRGRGRGRPRRRHLRHPRLHPEKALRLRQRLPRSLRGCRGLRLDGRKPAFDWPTLMANKDREIDRLNKVYIRNLEASGAKLIPVRAELEDAHTVRLADGGKVTAETILIATGALPSLNLAVPGDHLAITSNEAFHLPELPRRIVIAGGGYIAVEFAGIFNGLGVETTLVYRRGMILRGFDDDLRAALTEEMTKKGIRIITDTVFTRLDKTDDGIAVTLTSGEVLNVDQALAAIGRYPNTDGLGLDRAGVDCNEVGAVKVDSLSMSSVDNIYAIGDVTDRVNLTPVAIREGHAFADTVYGGRLTKVDHEDIPTAVFSQPEMGTVGLTEAAARTAIQTSTSTSRSSAPSSTPSPAATRKC